MPPPEADHEDAARFFAQREPDERALHIGKPEIIRIARFDKALPRPAPAETQHAQTVVILSDDDRAERRGFLVENFFVRTRQRGQCHEDEQCETENHVQIHS